MVYFINILNKGGKRVSVHTIKMYSSVIYRKAPKGLFFINNPYWGPTMCLAVLVFSSGDAAMSENGAVSAFRGFTVSQGQTAVGSTWEYSTRVLGSQGARLQRGIIQTSGPHSAAHWNHLGSFKNSECPGHATWSLKQDHWGWDPGSHTLWRSLRFQCAATSESPTTAMLFAG